MRAELLLGTQSWGFPAWVGSFYPASTKPNGMLAFYAKVFPTVEVDSTFYGAPSDAVIADWRGSVPEGFRFCLKLPQQITHERELADAADLLKAFLSRVRPLDQTLGPFLIQLSPHFVPNDARRTALTAFVASLPREFGWAVEFRHPGWIDNGTLTVLKDHHVALALADGRWMGRDLVFDCTKNPTANFSYLRWMGSGRHLTDYAKPQLDRSDELRHWADVLQSIRQQVGTVYGFFNNQFQGHSPHSVRELQRLMGASVVDPLSLHPQGELF